MFILKHFFSPSSVNCGGVLAFSENLSSTLGVKEYKGVLFNNEQGLRGIHRCFT